MLRSLLCFFGFHKYIKEYSVPTLDGFVQYMCIRCGIFTVPKRSPKC